MTTDEVENYPGFPTGITGPDLMAKMREQAERWGAELETDDVEKVDFTVRPFEIESAGGRKVKAHSCIIATGATARRLGLPSESVFFSRGISACAVCDGASPIFAGQEIGVVGGGDSAAEEAVYLTKYASRVHLIVRGAELRASKTLVDRVNRCEAVTVHYKTQVVDVFGDVDSSKEACSARAPGESPMTGCAVRDVNCGTSSELPLRGLFYAIGHTPATTLFQGGTTGAVALDEAGYIETTPGTPETSVRGVFAAGDVQDTEWRQAITAAGSGCKAALAAERMLVADNLVVDFDAQPPPAADEPAADDAPMEETLYNFDLESTFHAGSYALRRLYHETDRPIMVKYVSPTCGPCRALAPVLKRVAGEYDGQIYMVEIDIEADPDVAASGGVTGTPTVQIFHKKQLVDTVKGVKRRSAYRAVIDGALAE